MKTNEDAEAAENGDEALDTDEVSEDAEKGDSADADATDTTDENPVENDENTSLDEDGREQNGDSKNEDSNKNEVPAPVQNESDATTPVTPDNNGDEGEIYESSSDFANTAITLSSQDSNAPPGTLYDVSRPLESGQYFIRWDKNDNFWLGENENQITSFYNPEMEETILWQLTSISDGSYAGFYLLQIGQYYLARTNTSELRLVLSPVDDAYWNIVPYVETIDGVDHTYYYVFDLYKIDALSILVDDKGMPTSVVCNSSHGMPYGDGEYPGIEWRWIIDAAVERDWTINYFGNGTEDGSTDATQVTIAHGATIADSGFTRFGYSFDGWNTKPDGSGTAYRAGEHISGLGVLASNYVMKLYAQWKQIFVDIIYTVENGGKVQSGSSDKTSTVTQTVSAGDGLIKGSSDKTLAGVTAYPNEGYHFVTWKASGTLGDMPDAIRDRDKLTAEVVMGLSKYADEKTGYSLFHNITLTAIFATNTYTINYDANGGWGEAAPMTVSYGCKDILTKAAALKRERYLFAGWNTRADGTGITLGTDETLAALIKAGILADKDGASSTLYAMWTLDTAADPNEHPGDPNTPNVPVTDPLRPTTPPAPPADPSLNGSANGYTPYGGRGGNSGNGGNGGIPTAEAAEIAEAAEGMFEVPEVEEIQTIGAEDKGVFGGIADFLSTDTGRVVGTVAAVGVGVAAVAGVVGVGLSIAGASAGAAAAGAAGAAAAGAAGAASAAGAANAAGAAGAAGAGAAGAGAGAGGFFFRLRKRIARFFGFGKEDSEDDDEDSTEE